MRYINKFDTHSGYTEDKMSLERPSVSYCVDANHVHYDNTPTIITVNLNVTAETQSDFIVRFTNWSACDSVLLDGEPVEFNGYSNVITFTVGEHVVEYVFPHTTVCPGMGYGELFRRYMVSVIIPEGIKRIENYPCEGGFCPSIHEMAGTLSIPSTLEYVGVNAICDGVDISQEDVARLDSLCPVEPIEEGHHPWRAACGK